LGFPLYIEELVRAGPLIAALAVEEGPEIAKSRIRLVG